MADLADGSVQEYPRRGWGISPSGRFLFLYGETSDAPLQAALVDSREAHDFMAQKKWPQRSPVFSPDERWVTLHTINTPATRQIWIMPFQFGRPAPESDWISITKGESLDRNPTWSPDGNMLYWLADRGGVRGIWAVRLNPRDKAAGWLAVRDKDVPRRAPLHDAIFKHLHYPASHCRRQDRIRPR